MAEISNNIVQRFDFSRIGSRVSKTPQGFLRIPAYLTRAGVFEYISDGKSVREFRPPEEVFKEGSLSTFAGAPITDMHPENNGEPVAIDPSNVKKYQVGFVGESIKQDGEFMAATLTITDQSMISAIERGDRKEISNGYTCAIEEIAGEYNGQPYDCIQRNIIGNHVAIGPNDWGRAGPSAALRLDSKGAYLKTIHQIGDSAMENSFQVDKQEQKLPEQEVEVIKTTAAVVDGDARLIELQAKLDAAISELETEKKARADAEAGAQSLAKMMNQASSVLGSDYDFDGLSADDIMKAVVSQSNPNINLDGKSNDYISGCYDTIMSSESSSESEPEPEAEPKLDALDLLEVVKTDGLAKANVAAFQIGLATKEDAKAIMMDWKKNAWKENLAYNKNT